MIDNSQKIQQILERLTLAAHSEQNWANFDTIEIPFQLTQACFQLWTDCFSIPLLQNLANDDPDTLEAWAIALNSTLQLQLGILNQWMPLLNSPSLPPKLREKAEQRRTELERIAIERSGLIQATTQLLQQETQLRDAAAELSDLRTKINELQTIEAEIKATDITKLRAEVHQKENDLLPQKQRIEQLNQQKVDLDTQITLLQQQQEILQTEIESQRLCQNSQELEVMGQICTLQSFGETTVRKLNVALVEALGNLDRQRQEYNQQWEQLQQTLKTCAQYVTETEAIVADLKAHYQVDTVLAERLPVERNRVENLIQAIQNYLGELDGELKIAHVHHERSQQKQYITFGTPS